MKEKQQQVFTKTKKKLENSNETCTNKFWLTPFIAMQKFEELQGLRGAESHFWSTGGCVWCWTPAIHKPQAKTVSLVRAPNDFTWNWSPRTTMTPASPCQMTPDMLLQGCWAWWLRADGPGLWRRISPRPLRMCWSWDRLDPRPMLFRRHKNAVSFCRKSKNALKCVWLCLVVPHCLIRPFLKKYFTSFDWETRCHDHVVRPVHVSRFGDKFGGRLKHMKSHECIWQLSRYGHQITGSQAQCSAVLLPVLKVLWSPNSMRIIGFVMLGCHQKSVARNK